MPKQLICVVGGGEFQAPIVKSIQSMNFDALVINLYGDTKGSMLADYFEQADIVDREACLAIAEQYKPIAVLTDQTDVAVPTVAYIAEKLGLDGIGLEVAERFTNKLLMRQWATTIGVPCPDYSVVEDISLVREAATRIGFPLIVKPIDSQSSRGVVLVRSSSELDEAAQQAFKYSKRGKPILIEQYIEGQEWTVEGYKAAEGHVSLAASYKSHYPNRPTVADALNYAPLDSQHDVLINQNNLLVEGMGLPFGITHAEYKYMDGQYYLIEVAARGGGTKVSSDIIPLMSGVDVNTALIQDCLGNKTTILKPEFTGNFALLTFLEFESGIVKSVTPESEVLSLKGVIDFKYNFEPGDTIKPLEDDRSRHAHVLISADSESGIALKLEQVKSLVDVHYE